MSEFKGTKTEWELLKGTSLLGVQIGKTIFGISNINEVTKANALLISKAPLLLEMLKYFTAFPDEDFEEDMDKHISFPMTVDARKIKEAKQLIKEATEF